MLIVMPWWPAFWEHNYFALAWPPLRSFLSNNFVRGAVTRQIVTRGSGTGRGVAERRVARLLRHEQ